MVEDVFALAMDLEIGRHGSKQAPVFVLQRYRRGLPAAARTDAARILQRSEECMAGERIARRVECVPLLGGKIADAARDLGDQLPFSHR